MAYPNPSRGGLTCSQGGKTVGVWYQIGAPGLEALCVMEAIGPNQWEARWNSGFTTPESNQAKINAAGGEMQWLNSLKAQINNAIAQIYGAVPLPPAATTADKVNDALKNSFALTAGATSPVFGAK